MLKKIIALCLSFILVITISTGAMAADNRGSTNSAISVNGDTFELNGYVYTSTQSSGQYIITTTKDGAIIDRTTIQKGSDTIRHESFNANKAFSTNQSVVKYIKVSDIITQTPTLSSTPGQTAYAYALRSTSLGRIAYSAAYSGSGPVTRYLSFESTYVDSSPGDFKVAGDANTPVSVVVAAIVAGFKFFLPPVGLAMSIFLACAPILVGATLAKAFATTIRGTAYAHSVTATVTMAGDYRTSTHSGYVYDGKVQANGSFVYKTLYDGYYPQFIVKRDLLVANWFYDDFWSGDSHSISSWT